MGNTYGVKNEKGQPDLTFVMATNNEPEFVYATELPKRTAMHRLRNSLTRGSTRLARTAYGKSFSVAVYKSHGRTRVGKFVIDG